MPSSTGSWRSCCQRQRSTTEVPDAGPPFEPRERVERVAPWLRLDGNPYPAVVGRADPVDRRRLHRLRPITPTPSWRQLGDRRPADSLVTGAVNVRSIGEGQVNYIRNSVKATVDAYDGKRAGSTPGTRTIRCCKAWSQCLRQHGAADRRRSDGDLMGHLRYPEDLFKVQRDGDVAVSRGHRPGLLHRGQDFWQVSEDPERRVGDAEALTSRRTTSASQIPGQEQSHVLADDDLHSQAVSERQNLVGYMAVDADAGDTARRASLA